VANVRDTRGRRRAAYHARKAYPYGPFPENGVSERQKKQLTCWGDNVSSYAVRGTFDDCQKLVKAAFLSPELASRHRLSSANSINLGRLLPQTVYYVHAAVQYLAETGERPVVVVPSGNVGNAVGAYWARAMGAPISRIVLAVNANRTIPDFLAEGIYKPRPSFGPCQRHGRVAITTWSACERFSGPGNPDQAGERQSVSDEQIKATIKTTFESFGYALCPHSATRNTYGCGASRMPVILVATRTRPNSRPSWKPEWSGGSQSRSPSIPPGRRMPVRDDRSHPGGIVPD
jgi:threonine synthase